MRARTCGMSREEKENRRLNYCGACKAIGAEFGAKARLLLDHDAVFLAEILGALDGETFDDAPARLKSRNCLAIPGERIPKSLEFAAITNVALAAFKLADHDADGGGSFGVRAAGSILDSELKTAFAKLDEIDFPLVEIRALLASQPSREAAFESLDDVAFPTASTTAAFFGHGAKFVGRGDASAAMSGFGFAFGRLIYLLDAFEDFEKDLRRRQFNAFRAAFGIEVWDAGAKRRCAAVVRAAERECAARLRDLPIDSERFELRLVQNVARKLRSELPVVKRHRVCAPRPTLGQRWREAVSTARNLASGHRWSMPLVFLFVLALAFAAPAHTREARSARECVDLGLNLMVIGAVVAMPGRMLMGKFGGRRKKQAAGGGDGGAEDGGGGSEDGGDCFCGSCETGCGCCDRFVAECCTDCCCDVGCSACCDNCGCDCCDCSCD